MRFGRLLAREGVFFELFNEHGDRIAKSAQAFLAMVRDYGDPGARERHADEVESAECAADRVTRDVHRLLHRRFFTPIPRVHIHALIDAMDDITDLLQNTSEVMHLYNLTHIGEDVMRLSEISVRCCERVQYLVALLPQVRERETADAALRTCDEIDRLESDADRVMRAAMSRLFRDEIDTRELIKLKAVYEHLETISDRCEDVADIIEDIVLGHV